MRARVLTIAMLLFAGAAMAQSVTELPNGLAESYESKVYDKLSDEFNDKDYDRSKWYRRPGGGVAIEHFVDDDSLVEMRSEKDEQGATRRYITFIGTIKNGELATAGLTSRYTSFYGFYVTKFRYTGLDRPSIEEKKGSVWHPAIWSATQYAGKQSWLEIDFMEYGGGNWDCDAPARFMDSKGEFRKVITKGDDMEKAVMMGSKGKPDSEWHTIGLEYTPEYLRIWRWEDGKWIDISDREVRFVDDNIECPEKSYTPSTIAKSARKSQTWIIGNVVSRHLYPTIHDGTCTKDMSDMTLDVDYFRCYPHVVTKDMDWPYKNEPAVK